MIGTGLLRFRAEFELFYILDFVNFYYAFNLMELEYFR